MAEGTEKAAQRVPSTGRRSVLYILVRVFAFLAFHTLCPVKYWHAERLNRQGPFILISNHFSNWDPLVNAYPIRSEVTFLGKKELAASRLGALIFRRLHMIPIDRHNTDMGAVRSCMKALRDGEILGIYPEGTRHHQGIMEETEDGVALIALRGRVPVVPMLISSKVRPFHVTHVYAGEEIPTEDLAARGINRETCGEFMDRMKAAYAGMMKALGEERGR